jgi:hypothetical protein
MRHRPWKQIGFWSAIVVCALLLTGCPKAVPGSVIRIDEVDPGCRGYFLRAVVFQGNMAIGNFTFEVTGRYRAEFVIPQAVAQKIDFDEPVRIIVTLAGVKDTVSGTDCFLKGRTLLFTGKLVQKGTDPRTGNPVYVLNFWEDFKIEYR